MNFLDAKLSTLVTEKMIDFAKHKGHNSPLIKTAKGHLSKKIGNLTVNELNEVSVLFLNQSAYYDSDKRMRAAKCLSVITKKLM